MCGVPAGSARVQGSGITDVVGSGTPRLLPHRKWVRVAPKLIPLPAEWSGQLMRGTLVWASGQAKLVAAGCSPSPTKRLLKSDRAAFLCDGQTIPSSVLPDSHITSLLKGRVAQLQDGASQRPHTEQKPEGVPDPEPHSSLLWTGSPGWAGALVDGWRFPGRVLKCHPCLLEEAHGRRLSDATPRGSDLIPLTASTPPLPTLSWREGTTRPGSRGGDRRPLWQVSWGANEDRPVSLPP